METTTPTKLEQLKERRETLLIEREISELKRSNRVLDEASRVVDVSEAFQDIVNPREYLFDSPGFGFDTQDYRISAASDRKHGANWPFWQTEQELSQIRGIARHVASTDEVAISALDNLANYVLGRSGFEYEITPKAKQDIDPRIVAVAQSVIDSFAEENEWEGDLERELFYRSRRDGEFFLPLEDTGGGYVRAETIEPDEVTEPGNVNQLEDYLGLGPGLDWKFGIAKTPNRPLQRQGYFVQRFGDANDWDYLPVHPSSVSGRTACMIHARLNVDRVVCRGLSDFYAVYQDLERVSKLLGNTLQGGAIQAAIAYIKEHAAGTRESDITSARSGKVESTYNLPQGSSGSAREISTRRIMPGTVVSTVGTKYHAGPLGTPRGTSYIEIAQAGLRYVGQRWTMPEYLISGDASNGNFSSTLVAEAPFTKSIEAKQSYYTRVYKGVFWRVLEIAVRAGRFVRLGIDSSEFRLLKRLIDIDITPPEVAVRNRLEDHQIRQGEYAAGFLSLETWAAEAGRDLQAERDKGVEPVVAPPVGSQLQGSAIDDMSPAVASPAVVVTPEDAAPENTETTAGLNGAQITAAKDLLSELSAGTTAYDVAVELLVSLGLKRELAIKMANSAKAARVAEKPQLVQERLQQAAMLIWEGYP